MSSPCSLLVGSEQVDFLYAQRWSWDWDLGSQTAFIPLPRVQPDWSMEGEAEPLIPHTPSYKLRWLLSTQNTRRGCTNPAQWGARIVSAAQQLQEDRDARHVRVYKPRSLWLQWVAADGTFTLTCSSYRLGRKG